MLSLDWTQFWTWTYNWDEKTIVVLFPQNQVEQENDREETGKGGHGNKVVKDAMGWRVGPNADDEYERNAKRELKDLEAKTNIKFNNHLNEKKAFLMEWTKQMQRQLTIAAILRYPEITLRTAKVILEMRKTVIESADCNCSVDLFLPNPVHNLNVNMEKCLKKSKQSWRLD